MGRPDALRGELWFGGRFLAALVEPERDQDENHRPDEEKGDVGSDVEHPFGTDFGGGDEPCDDGKK